MLAEILDALILFWLVFTWFYEGNHKRRGKAAKLEVMQKMEEQAKTIKTYSRSELTVVWDPGLCCKSHECVKALPEVFRPDERPWVDMKAAETWRILEAVRLCPSGALTCRPSVPCESCGGGGCKKCYGTGLE